MVCFWTWVRLGSPCFADHERFSDVRLELDPILSGYRLHLIYDLYSPLTPLGEHPSASWLSDQATTYQRMLEQWAKLRENDGKTSPLVAFILEDEEPNYKHDRLSYRLLKENHTHKARFLEQQCIESNVCFWLARMSSSVDSSGYGASKSNFKLDRISELDGTEVVKGIVSIDKEDVVDIDSFKSRVTCREANDSDYAEQDSESEGTIHHFKDWVCYVSGSTTIFSVQKHLKPKKFSCYTGLCI